jgi:hypothetical protein
MMKATDIIYVEPFTPDSLEHISPQYSHSHDRRHVDETPSWPIPNRCQTCLAVTPSHHCKSRNSSMFLAA